jgi:hypothetical protein
MAQGGLKSKKSGAHGYGKQGKASKAVRKIGQTKKGGAVKGERKKFVSHHHAAVYQFKKKRSAIVRTSIEQEMAAQVMRANIPMSGLVSAGSNDVKPILAKRPGKKNPYAKRPPRPAKAMNPLDPKAMKQAAQEWAEEHDGNESD